MKFMDWFLIVVSALNLVMGCVLMVVGDSDGAALSFVLALFMSTHLEKKLSQEFALLMERFWRMRG